MIEAEVVELLLDDFISACLPSFSPKSAFTWYMRALNCYDRVARSYYLFFIFYTHII